MKCGSLNPLEPLGPVQACPEIVVPSPLPLFYVTKPQRSLRSSWQLLIQKKAKWELHKINFQLVITILIFQQDSRTALWGSVEVTLVEPISHSERVVFVRPFTHPKLNHLIYLDSVGWKRLLMRFVNRQSVRQSQDRRDYTVWYIIQVLN
jgi:hypothetical protein